MKKIQKYLICKDNSRLIYIDLLKIIAILMVITLHSGGVQNRLHFRQFS